MDPEPSHEGVTAKDEDKNDHPREGHSRVLEDEVVAESAEEGDCRSGLQHVDEEQAGGDHQPDVASEGARAGPAYSTLADGR